MDAVLINEIPVDALTALVTERRQRYTTEAESFRLARTAVRAMRAERVSPRRRAAGARVTAADVRPCA